jgi:hypothetical protein
VPRASLRASNLETGVTTSGVSNDQGTYEIPYLSPGRYRLEVEVTGFKRWTQSEIEVRTAERLRIDGASYRCEGDVWRGCLRSRRASFSQICRRAAPGISSRRSVRTEALPPGAGDTHG